MAGSIQSVVVAIVPLCSEHARAIMAGRWALQVEPARGGPWIDGSQGRR
jgi:hypothetical protein